MARRRFFVQEIRNQHAEIQGEDARHLAQVLRVEAGQQYEISDNRNAWLAEIETARKDRVTFRTIAPVAPREAGPRLALYLALIRFERFELAIEKATELGAASITPVVTGRSERGLERAASKRLLRWRRIALESSQQSRRDRLPEVEAPVRFERALAHKGGVRLFLDEEPGGAPLLQVVQDGYESAAIIVGPEGGWTGEERSAAAGAGWQRVYLGPQILRAETAALASLAILGAAVRKS